MHYNRNAYNTHAFAKDDSQLARPVENSSWILKQERKENIIMGSRVYLSVIISEVYMLHIL